MSRLLVVLVACASLDAAASAQKPIVPPAGAPPAPPSSVRETQRPLTVQGCIFDKRLKYDASLAINRPASALFFGGYGEFVLEGPKELMRQLKADHDGHEEQIVGIVTIPPDNGDTLTTQKRVGSKTTIIASGSQKSTAADDPDRNRAKVLRLKIEEVRHVQDKCPYPF